MVESDHERFPRENIPASDIIEINDPSDRPEIATVANPEKPPPEGADKRGKKARTKKNEGRRGGKKPYQRDARDQITPKHSGPRRTPKHQFDASRCTPLTWTRDPLQRITVNSPEEFSPRTAPRYQREAMSDEQMELFRENVRLNQEIRACEQKIARQEVLISQHESYKTGRAETEARLSEELSKANSKIWALEGHNKPDFGFTSRFPVYGNHMPEETRQLMVKLTHFQSNYEKVSAEKLNLLAELEERRKEVDRLISKCTCQLAAK